MSANHAILSKVLLRKLARPVADGSERTDGELLSRFVDFKEESAFAELLNNKMMWGWYHLDGSPVEVCV